jgi:hypothetical protein
MIHERAYPGSTSTSEPGPALFRFPQRHLFLRGIPTPVFSFPFSRLTQRSTSTFPFKTVDHYSNRTAIPHSGQALGRSKEKNVSYVNPTPVPLLSAVSLTRAGGLRFVLRSFRSHGYAIQRSGPHVKHRPRRTGLLPRRTGLLIARR